MEPNEVDALLRHHTPHEDRYLAGWTNPSIQDKVVDQTIDGQSVQVLPQSQVLPQASLESFPLGKKHSRFMDFPAHRHQWVELNYMYAGSCVQVIDGQEVVFSEGQTLLFDRDTLHKIPPLGEGDILLNVIPGESTLRGLITHGAQDGGLVTDLLMGALNDTAAHDRYLLFPTQHSGRMRRLVTEYFGECLEPGVSSKSVLASLFNLMTIELVNVYRDESTLSELDRGRAISVIPVLAYMEQHYQDITLEQTAHTFGANPSYLSRLLKERTGSSFQALLTRRRMAVAATFLSEGQGSVAQVARAVGYENVTFFYRKFRAAYGCSPGEFRERHGTDKEEE